MSEALFYDPAVIRNVLKDEQIAALSDVGAGVSQAELAAESGMSQAAKRKEFQRLREKVLDVLGSKSFKSETGTSARKRLTAWLASMRRGSERWRW